VPSAIADVYLFDARPLSEDRNRSKTRAAMKTTIATLAALLSLGTGQAPVGAISGVVRDVDGGVVPGARVTAIRGSDERRTITNSAGRYRLDGLTPGPYRLEAYLTGFRRAVADAIAVGPAGDAECSFVLQLGILTHADFVAPPGGFQGALRTANAVLHLRVAQVVDARLLGPSRTLLTVEHRAHVLSVAKDDTGRIRQGEAVTFWQVQAGEWIEDGRRFVGQNQAYRVDDELVGLFEREPDGKLVELTGGHFVFRVVDGTVAWQREPLVGIRERMPVAEFVRALLTIMAERP
jgi:hypothetical protein